MGAQAVRLSNVDIDNALKNKDFEVLFQPIFDLGNGALARMETFVRWRHPTLGVLPPGAFISFFESQGRMSELTRYVLSEALACYTGWRGTYAPGFSINLALTDLTDEAFTSHFAKLLRDANFPADLVTLECPMPPVDIDLKAAQSSFEQLRTCGARLAIEVRGRANDFLKNIDPFPFDEIKTGGSSILRFARTVRGPGLSAISDLLDIANRANAAITAVGVEDQASLSALRGLGFTAAQGNHLAKVGDLNEFRPGRVNEVRELLDLPALSADDLTALFRTEAPTPRAASVDSTDSAVDAANPASADQPNVSSEESEPTELETSKKSAGPPSDVKARALAKRARARELRKAAAIKRAKEKATEIREEAEQSLPVTDGEPKKDEAQPRAMQQRLADEFKTSPDETAKKTAGYASDDSKRKKTKPQAAKNPDSAEPPAKNSSQLPSNKEAADATAPSDVTANNATASVAEASPSTQTHQPDDREPPASNIEDPKMSIDGARAYFQPGVRVAAGPGNTRMKTAVQPKPAVDFKNSDPIGEALNAAEKATTAKPETIQSELPLDSSDSSGAEGHEPNQTDQAPTSLLTDNNDVVLGHLQEEFESDDQPAPVKKSKSFFTRKYRLGKNSILPDHFWPKPWKRRYSRWQVRRSHATEIAPESEPNTG